MAKNTYMGQEILFLTRLFGKEYLWMKDPEGLVYLAKVEEDDDGGYRPLFMR